MWSLIAEDGSVLVPLGDQFLRLDGNRADRHNELHEDLGDDLEVVSEKVENTHDTVNELVEAVGDVRSDSVGHGLVLAGILMAIIDASNSKLLEFVDEGIGGFLELLTLRGKQLEVGGMDLEVLFETNLLESIGS